MPQSLAIGAFVFGAVLVLLSLAGGGFKLFGAEVSGAAGKMARAVSFVLGLGLIAVGFSSEMARKDVGSLPAPPPPREGTVVPNPPPGTDNAPPSPGNTTAPAVPLAVLPTQANIAGIWWDGNGTQYQIEQAGIRFRFAAANATNGMTSQGTGIVSGVNLQTEFRTSYGAVGRAQGVISADGRQVAGTCWDSVYGNYPFFLRR